MIGSISCWLTEHFAPEHLADQIAEHAIDVKRVHARDAILDPLVDERLNRLPTRGYRLMLSHSACS